MRFYNRTRGPLSFSLNSGKNELVAAKSYVTLHPGDAASSSVLDYVQAGFLVYVASAIEVGPVDPAVPVEAISAKSEQISETEPKSSDVIGGITEFSKPKVAGRRKSSS
jgi:hypothetical protein